MRLRARHLACLLLLLSSLGSAEAATLRSGALTPGGRYVFSVLQQSAAANRRRAHRCSVPRGPTPSLPLPASSLAAVRVAWTMRPPAAHTAALHTLTAMPASNRPRPSSAAISPRLILASCAIMLRTPPPPPPPPPPKGKFLVFNKLLAKVFGTSNERAVKRMLPTLAQINAFEASIKALTDDQLKAKTAEFKAYIAKQIEGTHRRRSNRSRRKSRARSAFCPKPSPSFAKPAFAPSACATLTSR